MKKVTYLLAAAGLMASTFGVQAEHKWKTISAGDATTYAIRDDGTLWTCGWNEKGQLGVSVGERTAVWQSPSSDTNWAFVAGGKAYGFAIKTDGTLWAVGSSTEGVQGTGDGIDHKTFVQIGTDTDWAMVTTVHFWGYTAAAIKTDGTLWAWGSNGSNQLGNGATGKNEVTPIQIGTDNDWAYVTLGKAHALAVKKDGTLWGWGSNYGGQLGDGTAKTAPTPIQIGTDSDWAYVKALDDRSYAVKKDGSLYVAGSNYNSLLGLNQEGENIVTQYNTFTKAENITEKVLSVEGCENVTVISTGENGVISKVYLVGDNTDGALGDGNGKLLTAQSSSDEMPRSYTLVNPLLPEGKTYTTISSGQNYTMVITAEGELYAWGRNKGGQLGDGTDTDMLPTSIYKKPVLIACPQEEPGSVAEVAVDNAVKVIGNTVYANETISNVNVFSLTGALVKSAGVVEGSWDLDTLEKGVYLLQYSVNGHMNTIKFIKQ